MNLDQSGIDINAVVCVKAGFVTHPDGNGKWKRFEANHKTKCGGVTVVVSKHDRHSNRVEVTLVVPSGKAKTFRPNLGYYVIHGIHFVPITKDEVNAAFERDKERRVVAEIAQRRAAMKLATEEV